MEAVYSYTDPGNGYVLCPPENSPPATDNTPPPDNSGSGGGGGGDTSAGTPGSPGGGGSGIDCTDPANSMDPSCLLASNATPQPGLKCDNSPLNLGTSNLPGNQNSRATTVQNIFGMTNADTDTYGWFYQTVNQALWWQRNPGEAQDQVNIVTGIFDKIPGLAGLGNVLASSTTKPYQVTAAQAQNIQRGLQQSGYKVHKCFSGPLTV